MIALVVVTLVELLTLMLYYSLSFLRFEPIDLLLKRGGNLCFWFVCDLTQEELIRHMT